MDSPDRPRLAAYPPDVPRDFEPPDVPLTQLLDDAAAAFPQTVAVLSSGSRWTYRQVHEQVDALAAGLRDLPTTAIGKALRRQLVAEELTARQVTP